MELEPPQDEAHCCLPNIGLILSERKRKLEMQREADREAAKIMERMDQIRKAKIDDFDYRYILLENDLKVLLVSTADSRISSNSAASLDIRIGSFSDPVHLQGLAHLCEHVLFTGSETFPNESYSHFLGARGGSSNAYTTSEHTNFHFEIPSLHFEDALARFVSFFECPLFRDVSVKNEVDIIQSEHEKNRFNDAWRTNQVERATANESHAFSKFSTGTRQSLTLDPQDPNNKNLRYEVFTFFKANYSSNLMTVCLLHNEPLDQLEHIAKAYLLKIPNRNVPESIWPRKAFKASQMRTKIFVLPVKDIYHLNMTFPMEDFSQFYFSAPEGYVAQLLGHKGPGGLFSHLKNLGYAHHIIASAKVLAKGFSFFGVTVQMTEHGERHVDSVVKLVFQYINLIREAGPQRWFFDEISFHSEQQFQNKDVERPQTYVCNITHSLHLFKPQDALVGDFVINNFRPDLILKVLKYLIPENVRITILSKNSKYFVTEVEPHYGTEYHMEKIPDDVISGWKKCGINPDHSLPKPNELIDYDMEIVEIEDQKRHHEGAKPDLFIWLDRIRMRSWYKPALHFNLAKSCTYVKFSCPELSNCTASSCNLNNLFVFLVRNSLEEYAYHGQLAGIFYSLRPLRDGVELMIRGYSAKQHIFLKNVLEKFYSPVFVQKKYQQVLEVHGKGLESAMADTLKSQATNLLNSILCARNYSRQQRLKALKEASFESFSLFADAFRVQCSQECFFFGNLTLLQADRMSNILIEERKRFLEDCAERHKVKVQSNAYLEEWFLKNSVERIVMTEDALRETVFKSETDPDPPKKVLQQNGIVHQVQVQIEVSPASDKSDQEVVDKSPDRPEEVQPAFNQEYILPSGSSNVFLIDNELESSSCVLFFLQFKANEPSNSAILDLLCSLIRPELISAMKHEVSLGYVVSCDVRNINQTLGLRIVVQSQYPLKLVHDTIEQCLANVDSFLNMLTEEVLQNAKESLIGARLESRLRMREAAAKTWKEILDLTYNFDRIDLEVEAIKAASLEDLKSCYQQWIQSGGEERRKLVLSYGPDPILNTLDDLTCSRLSQVPDLQAQCRLFPLLKKEDMAQWYQQVFESEVNDYKAPHL